MERKDWIRFLNELRWQQGEHVSIFGRTRSGKTTLALELIKKRTHVVLLLNKVKDRVSDAYIRDNDYDKVKSWDKANVFKDKVALWPPFEGTEDFDTQAAVFRAAISGTRKQSGIFLEGGWTIVIDEVLYFTDSLHLTSEMRMLWTQGASNDITVVASSQRPRGVPQLMLDQATHFFLFGVTDKYEIQRISEVMGNKAQEVRDTLPGLAEHEFLYVNPQKNQSVRSIVRKRSR